MDMSRHDEEGIHLGHWDDTTLFPTLAGEENVSPGDVADIKTHRNVFRMIQNESLDRNLERHHITGIALSGTIGIGLFINSGDYLGLSGSVGLILSYLFAGLIVMSVMMCLSEMVSVRPVPGAIFEYPKLYVDPALGYAVGFIYWLAYSMSLATLTVSAAALTNYWPTFPIHIGWIILILIIGIACSNVFGVRIYGNLEWAFKWMKILLIVGLDIIMIAINVGAGQDGKGSYIGAANFATELQFPTGFSSNHLNSTSSPAQIQGSTGIFLGVWTSITLIGYGFIGVELIVVTAGEAKYPRRDLPKASRRVYLVTILLYLLSAILIAFNVPYTDPNLLGLSNNNINNVTGLRSPYIIAMRRAGFTVLASFINGCFLFAAWTAANTALYVSSRTLYALARSSDVGWFKRSVGRTSSEGTPLVAIGLSFMFCFLAFVGCQVTDGPNIVSVCSRISTNSILCVYIAECVAFLRFREGMKHARSINRDDPEYKKYFYRSPRQPLPAYFAIVSCSCLVFFSGWNTFYNLAQQNISPSNAAADLISEYIGPILFLGFYLGYKFAKNTHMTSYANFGNSYTPMEAGLDNEPRESSNAIVRFLSWIR